jgi:signal transduction histidine kinase
MMTELAKITGIHGGYLIARTGPAVDLDLMPRRLYNYKIATKSHSAIGLGLFISRSVVEARGGITQAENNRSVLVLSLILAYI